jgi:hypothetical protein
LEYRGDLTPPDTSYASVLPTTPLTTRLFNPSSTNRTGSAVVTRAPRRNGQLFFYAHGAVTQPNALPNPGAASIGNVNSSAFQTQLVQLFDWQKNIAWHEAGYPRNLGLSTRVPQLETNVTGGPGKSSSDQRPLFTKVQQVQRARVVVRSYPTKSAMR